MDKYQKLAFILTLFILAIIILILILLFDLSLIQKCIIVGCVGLVVVGAFSVNKKMRQYLNPNLYPNNEWYRKHHERNYDAIVLGDEIDGVQFDRNCLSRQKAFFLFLENQNLFSDFVVLKNTFSILKPKGKVIVNLREASILYSEQSLFDERKYYWALSPYVFSISRWKIMYIKVATRIPILLLRLRDVSSFTRKYIFRVSRERRIKRKIIKEQNMLQTLTSEEIAERKENQKKLIDEIREFCHVRDIELDIIFTECFLCQTV